MFVHRYVKGYVRSRMGDQNFDREPGSVYVLDLEHRIEGVQRPATVQGILIPKSVLRFHPDSHPPLLKLSTAHPMGQAIDAVFDNLFDGLLQANAIDQILLDRMIACLRVVMNTDLNDGDIRRRARDALTEVISSHVEANIDDWDLSVTTILRNFGVSRASLYRMFEARGGVRQFISDRRLLRAVLDLSKRPILRGDISAAADRWGFTSGVSFNRAVKREFGVSPASLINHSEADHPELARSIAQAKVPESTAYSVERLANSEPLLSS